ncbi:MAG: PAS domain S-box protein [Anaerolineae bacterium]|nr:PAS domain S-box protein [Anaerolineae bacterium]
MKYPQPLRGVLSRLLFLRLFLPALVIAFLTMGLAVHIAGSNLAMRQVLIARSIARAVDFYLEHVLVIFDSLVSAAESGGDEALAIYMESLWRTSGHFDTIYRLNREGIITLMVPSDPRYRDLDMSNQPYFRQPVTQTVISSPFMSPRTGRPTVYVLSPLSNGDLLVGELSLTELQRTIEAEGDTRYLITDRSGNLLAYPDPAWVAQQVNLSNLAIFKRGLQGEVTRLYALGQTVFLGSVTSVAHTGWLVVAQTPIVAVYGPYLQAVGLAVATAAAIWLTILSFQRQLDRHVAVPLTRLSFGAEAVAAGDYALGAELSKIPALFTEVGTLAGNFVRMGEAIQAREAALLASETRFREMAELLPDMIFEMDADLRVTYANRIALETFGYTREELDAGIYARQLLAEEEQSYLADLEIVRDNRSPVDRTYRVRRKDGTTFQCEIRVAPIYDPAGTFVGLRGVARDITERLEAEEALRRSEEKYRTILESIEDGYYEVDLAGNLTFFNSALCRILGYPADELLGMNNRRYMDEETARAVYHVFNHVYRTGEPTKAFDWKLIRKDGSTIFIEASISLIRNAEGRPIGFRGLCRDITERRRVYEEIRRRAAHLVALNAIIAAANTATELTGLLETTLRHTLEALGLEQGVIWTESKQVTHNLPPEFGLALAQASDTLYAHASWPFAIEDWRASHPELATVLAPYNVRALLCTPLKPTAGCESGGIILTFPSPRRWLDEEIALLEAVGGQLATAIERLRLLEAEREQRELAEALAEAAASVNRSLKLDEVLDQILAQVARVVPGDAFNIMLVEDSTVRMVRWRGYETLVADEKLSSLVMPITAFPGLKRMADTGEPSLVFDTMGNPDWVFREGWEWIRSYIGAPIRVDRVTVGFLNVDGTRPGQFGPRDAQRLQTFTDYVATAISNAMLYQKIRAYADELERRVQERTAQLRSQLSRVDAILRSTADGIIVSNAKGEVVHANPVAHAWLTTTLSPEDARELREAVRRLTFQAETQAETVLELSGLDLQLKVAPVTEPGLEEVTAVIAVHDVTYLRALDRMKARFVSNVSHELRTPITTIKLYATLLQQTTPQSGRWREYVDALVKEADHQARLIEDILEISRLDAGRLEMHPRPTSLNELAEQVVADRMVLAQQRHHRLEYRPWPESPVVLVDPERMVQVVSNLLENAIRYTPEGGTITVTTSMEEAEGRLWGTVTVADTGIGIPEDELPHIFERFFRGAEVRAMQISGTGLGLSIVKEIVEFHGGKVTVKSRVGEGSVFTVWLPMLSAADEEAGASSLQAGD